MFAAQPPNASALAHADDVLADVRASLGADVSRYSDALTAAFSSVDPIFTRPRYKDFFWHCASTVPGWLGRTVLANAEVESQGAVKLLRLWQSVDYNDEVEQRVLGHARDESRHSRFFVRLAELAFPASVDLEATARLKATLPDVRRATPTKVAPIPEELLIDHLVQMNIGEIRTRIHVHFLAPVVVAFTPAEDRDSVIAIFQALVADELRHISYTADLMESWAKDGQAELITSLYERRLRDFDAVTVRETEGAVRDFGQGRYPDLLDLFCCGACPLLSSGACPRPLGSRPQ
jgi:hypothetical protein